MKKRKKAIVCIMAMLWLMKPMVAFAEDEDLEVYCGIPFETAIAQPEQIDQWLVYLNGVLKIEEDGMILYYSEQDYQYDTRENAIWFPEREDYSIEAFLKDHSSLQNNMEMGVIKMDVYNSIGCIMDTKGCEEYAGKAYYLNTNDEKDKEKFERKAHYIDKEKRYDRNKEQEEANPVSYYRLMGDPWRYDGEKVKLEAVYMATEDGLISANQDTLSYRGIWEELSVNGEVDEYNAIKAWKAFTEEYDCDILFALIAGEKLHVWNTCMFYMDGPWFQEFEFLGYGGMRPRYRVMELDVHEKDLPRLRELIREYESR